MDPWIRRQKAYQMKLQNQSCWKAFEKTVKNSNFITRANKMTSLDESNELKKDIFNHYKKLASAYGVLNSIRNKHKTYTILDQLRRSEFRKVKFMKQHLSNLKLSVH